MVRFNKEMIEALQAQQVTIERHRGEAAMAERAVEEARPHVIYALALNPEYVRLDVDLIGKTPLSNFSEWFEWDPVAVVTGIRVWWRLDDNGSSIHCAVPAAIPAGKALESDRLSIQELAYGDDLPDGVKVRRL